jgi:hypothetical protein
MPYFLFKITEPSEFKLVKQLELIETFGAFRDAKTAAKQLRAEVGDGDCLYKVMFAENQLSAEEQLLEKREKPVLMEHER